MARNPASGNTRMSVAPNRPRGPLTTTQDMSGLSVCRHERAIHELGLPPILDRIDVLHAVARQDDRNRIAGIQRKFFAKALGAAPIELTGIVMRFLKVLRPPFDPLRMHRGDDTVRRDAKRALDRKWE